MLRFLIVLMAPSMTLAAGVGVMDVGPLFGGPRAAATVGLANHPRGQEVLLEIYATSDLPGAKEAFLGQSKTVVAGPGAIFIDSTQVAILISDPLPDTQKEWKIRCWHSPTPGSKPDTTLIEVTIPRTPRARK